MNVRQAVRVALFGVLITVGLTRDAVSQSSVGSGPLTSSLTDTEPTSGVLSYGRLKLAPGMSIREIGWVDNVFDEPDSAPPKEDYVASVQPDLAAFTRLRFVQLSAYGAADLTYYHTYSRERYRGYVGRGRVDFLLSNLRPFAAYGETRTRERPNGEIDVRADQLQQEASGGVAYDLSPHSLFYAAAYHYRNFYEDALQQGVNLGDTLTHDDYNYQGGIKTDLTPLLSMQLYGSYQEDKFRSEPIRNAISRNFTSQFRLGADAAVTGLVMAGYRNIHYADPTVKSFRGMVGSAALAIPVMEVGRITVTAQRSVEYSFDVAEAYYLESTLSGAYTHRLFGKVDAQAKAERSTFDYSARETEPAHQDTLDTATGSLGYNLPNRTRVAINYEYTRRRSPAFSVRNYQRRRVFLSWSIAF